MLPPQISPQSDEHQTEFFHELSARLGQAMPLFNFGEGMQLVAETWWQLLQAEAVLLVAPAPGEQHVWASFFSNRRSFSEFEQNIPLEAGWAENLLPLVQQKWDELTTTDEPLARQTLLLRSTGPVRGILIFSHADECETPELSQAAELTTRFLDQIRLVNSPASETQLQELKLKSLAEFAAGAGHEINNPLASISGRAQMLLRDETDYERRQSLATIGAQALRIRDMIGDLMLFGRPPEPKLEAVSLHEAVSNVIANLQQTDNQSEIVETLDSPEVRLQADSTQLSQVLRVLFENSLELSSEAKSSPPISIRWTTSPEKQGQVQIEITDLGPGLSELDQTHLFDPFYSGRQAGRGLGFGLSKVWQITQQHDATIELLPNENRGTKAILHWPQAAAS